MANRHRFLSFRAFNHPAFVAPPRTPPALALRRFLAEPPCQSGEQQVSVTGVPGSFCSPPCLSSGSCPTDVPPGTTAQPECVLEFPGNKTATYCALICSPGPSAGCPTGAKCHVSARLVARAWRKSCCVARMSRCICAFLVTGSSPTTRRASTAAILARNRQTLFEDSAGHPGVRTSL